MYFTHEIARIKSHVTPGGKTADTGTRQLTAKRKLTVYDIGRKLTYKRHERRLVQSAVQHIAFPIAQTPSTLPLQKFKAILDTPAEDSKPRLAPKPLPPGRAVTNPNWQQTYQEWTHSHADRSSGLTPDMLRRENLYCDDE